MRGHALTIGFFVVAFGATSAACGGGGDASLSREAVIEDIVQDGITRDQATCIVDDMEKRGIDLGEDWSGASRREMNAMFRAMNECIGLGWSDCLSDALVDIAGPETFTHPGAFVRTVEELSVDDKIQFMEAGFVCQGASAAVARCITDGVQSEFGREVFASERLELTPKQQTDVQEIQTACALDEMASEDADATSDERSTFDLAVGDCWILPDGDRSALVTVRVVPCNEPHDREVVALIDAPDGPYPGAEEFDRTVQSQCWQRAEEYIGADLEDSIYDVVGLNPTAATWAQGDRETVCNVLRFQGGQLDQSAKA